MATISLSVFGKRPFTSSIMPRTSGSAVFSSVSAVFLMPYLVVTVAFMYCCVMLFAPGGSTAARSTAESGFVPVESWSTGWYGSISGICSIGPPPMEGSRNRASAEPSSALSFSAVVREAL